MNKTFCAVPWIQLSTRPDGNIRICCLMTNSDDPDKGSLRKENGSFFKAGEGDIDLAMNSEKIKKLRRELLSGKQPNLCKTCWEKESLGSASKRTTTNKNFSSFIDIGRAREMTSENGEITHFIPYYLDIRLGNQCNLKCTMCHPGSSSKWYSDYQKIFKKDYFLSNHQKISLVKKEKTDPFEWYKSRGFWDYIDKHIHEIQQVYLVGGEPLILTEHETFLQHCIRSGFASNIHLEYDTNLTYLNNAIIKYWESFKKITLRVSIDSVGTFNDYIRYPSSWEKIKENLGLVQKMIKVNIQWSITATWQIYNLVSVLDILHDFPEKSHIRILSSPKFLDVKILPEKLKKYAITRLENSLGWSAEKRKINGLITYLKKNHSKNEERLKEFASFTKKMDEIRSLSFKETFPDIYTHLKDYF